MKVLACIFAEFVVLIASKVMADGTKLPDETELRGRRHVSSRLLIEVPQTKENHEADFASNGNGGDDKVVSRLRGPVYVQSGNGEEKNDEHETHEEEEKNDPSEKSSCRREGQSCSTFTPCCRGYGCAWFSCVQNTQCRTWNEPCSVTNKCCDGLYCFAFCGQNGKPPFDTEEGGLLN